MHAVICGGDKIKMSKIFGLFAARFLFNCFVKKQTGEVKFISKRIPN